MSSATPCLPLTIQGKAIGAITFVSAESGREYTDRRRGSHATSALRTRDDAYAGSCAIGRGVRKE
jgi:hypothetical protein